MDREEIILPQQSNAASRLAKFLGANPHLRDQLIELLQAHPHLGAQELRALISRGNGVLSAKEIDTDIDSSLLNAGLAGTGDED